MKKLQKSEYKNQPYKKWPYKFCYSRKSDRIKSDHINFDHIKSGSIKSEHINFVTYKKWPYEKYKWSEFSTFKNVWIRVIKYGFRTLKVVAGSRINHSGFTTLVLSVFSSVAHPERSGAAIIWDLELETKLSF